MFAHREYIDAPRCKNIDNRRFNHREAVMSIHPHVVVIGAGPVGLTAAAHLVRRGIDFTVLEAGTVVGASVRQWGHVRLFSPWALDLDPEAVALLREHGWTPPASDEHPTGHDVVDRYLEPLAAHPDIRARLRLGATVTDIARQGRSRLDTAGRADAPLVVRYVADGLEQEIVATAVIDASGTWTNPNPLGAAGIPARGELAAADRIRYGIPDVLGADRDRYANRRIAVAGGGHSAANVLLDLAELAASAPKTEVSWLSRRPDAARLVGGGADDELPERGRLGGAVTQLIAAGAITVEHDFRADSVTAGEDGVAIGDGDRLVGPFDEVIVATGLRPDLRPLRELRLDLDEIVEAPRALAPLIDPNVHSCGSVPPHGFIELSHPEPGYFIVGMKSYGRAPTFLLRTGYEQVRSVVAALAGDLDAASRIELVLPATGACSLAGTPSGAGSREPMLAAGAPA
jgi:glycine/D-amino acid oxidase-like deaminating enzyme